MVRQVEETKTHSLTLQVKQGLGPEPTLLSPQPCQDQTPPRFVGKWKRVGSETWTETPPVMNHRQSPRLQCSGLTKTGVVPMCRTQCRCDQMGHCLPAAPDWTPTPRRADTDVDDDDGASHAHVAGVLHMPRTVPVFAEAEGTSSNPLRPRVCGLAHLQPPILHPPSGLSRVRVCPPAAGCCTPSRSEAGRGLSLVLRWHG